MLGDIGAQDMVIITVACGDPGIVDIDLDMDIIGDMGIDIHTDIDMIDMAIEDRTIADWLLAQSLT